MTSGNNTYKHCMVFTNGTNCETRAAGRPFKINVDSPQYKMRMNFKWSSELYTNDLNKGQNYAGKKTE